MMLALAILQDLGPYAWFIVGALFLIAEVILYVILFVLSLIPVIGCVVSILWLLVGQRRPDQIQRPLARLERKGIELVTGTVTDTDTAANMATHFRRPGAATDSHAARRRRRGLDFEPPPDFGTAEPALRSGSTVARERKPAGCRRDNTVSRRSGGPPMTSPVPGPITRARRRQDAAVTGRALNCEGAAAGRGVTNSTGEQSDREPRRAEPGPTPSRRFRCPGLVQECLYADERDMAAIILLAFNP